MVIISIAVLLAKGLFKLHNQMCQPEVQTWMKNLVSLAHVKNKEYLLVSAMYEYTDHFCRSILSQLSLHTTILV